MIATVGPAPDGAPRVSPSHATPTDDEEVARWAAFFESLPSEEREGLDELGREIGARLPKR